MDEDPGDALLNAIEIERHTEPAEELFGSINSTSSDLKYTEEEKLRLKLRFFYMNPIEKWEFKQRFPYKFLVQLVKIVVITLQACLFAHHRSFYVNFVSENQIAFSHLFLQGWDPSREIISYPPQAGDLAVYKISDFYSAIDYSVVNYAKLDEAVGAYSYTEHNNTIAPLMFCVSHYKTCDIFGFNESFVFNNNILKSCVNITVNKENVGNFSTETFLREKNATIHFPSLVEARLSFGIKTVNLKPPGPKAVPDCYRFDLTTVYNNEAHDGKIKLTLDMAVYRLNCKGTINYKSDTQLESILHSLINSVVIIFCIISFLLCSRAVYRAQLLRKKTVDFFAKYHNRDLSLNEKLEFVDWWYIIMIISDFITIIGSALKEKIEHNEFSGDEWNICSALLGVGTFLIWFCVLRYLGFFETYNVIVLTMKVATPIIFRFLVCTSLIYAGFTFCGWLVLGPYHTKFRTLSVTSECLFALINGDDVFGTFSTLEPTNSVLMWWFCRIYLYFFVSLFIYVILSLFVSLILDAYETIKKYYAEGFPKNSIKEFVDGSLYKRVFSESSSSLANDIPQCYPNIFTRGLKCLLDLICCRTTNQPRTLSTDS